MNFSDCMNEILPFEGGYVNHPRDPGGATNMGITHKTLADWRGGPVTIAEVRTLTKSEAITIYRKKYADPINFDNLFPGVNLIVLDSAINSGVSRGKKWLFASLDKSNNHAQTVKNIAKTRMSFLTVLSTWPTFGKGWTRRVSHMEAVGVREALAAMPGQTTEKVQQELQVEEAVAAKKAQTNGATAAGSAATGGATTGVGVDAMEQPNVLDFAIANPLVIALIAATLCASLVFAWYWWINRNRAAAFAAVSGA